MNRSSINCVIDVNPIISRKWRIGGVLSSDLSAALLDLAARDKNKPFPWRPTAVKPVLSN